MTKATLFIALTLTAICAAGAFSAQTVEHLATAKAVEQNRKIQLLQFCRSAPKEEERVLCQGWEYSPWNEVTDAMKGK